MNTKKFFLVLTDIAITELDKVNGGCQAPPCSGDCPPCDDILYPLNRHPWLYPIYPPCRTFIEKL